MTLLFAHIYLILLYIRLELYVFGFSQYVIHLLTLVRESFKLIVLVNHQVLVLNIASCCLIYKFKTTKLQRCGHDMLMCF